MYTTFATSKVGSTDESIQLPKPMAAFSLKNIPADILKFILEEQQKIKEKKGVRVYSMDLTVYHLLRELRACRKGEELPIN